MTINKKAMRLATEIAELWDDYDPYGCGFQEKVACGIMTYCDIMNGDTSADIESLTALVKELEEDGDDMYEDAKHFLKQLKEFKL